MMLLFSPYFLFLYFFFFLFFSTTIRISTLSFIYIYHNIIYHHNFLFSLQKRLIFLWCAHLTLQVMYVNVHLFFFFLFFFFIFDLILYIIDQNIIGHVKFFIKCIYIGLLSSLEQKEGTIDF